MPNLEICRECGYDLNEVTGVNGRRAPRPGDWCVCFNCGCLSIFDERLMYVAPTAQQLAALQADEEDARALRLALATVAVAKLEKENR